MNVGAVRPSVGGLISRLPARRDQLPTGGAAIGLGRLRVGGGGRGRGDNGTSGCDRMRSSSDYRHDIISMCMTVHLIYKDRSPLGADTCYFGGEWSSKQGFCLKSKYL